MYARRSTIFSSATLSFAEYYPDWVYFMPNNRGNPNWGRPMLPASVMCTQFEMQVKQLRLTPEGYVTSAELHTWCDKNRNQCYIPEWLLDEWGFRVHDDLTGTA